MGLIKRLQRITTARVQAFLETVDDPATAIPQLVAEMEEKVGVAANAEAKALSAVKSTQRKLDEAQGRVLRMGRGAELALKQGDERTAREALAEQVKAEKDVAAQKESMARAEAAFKDARDVRLGLAGQLDELKVRRDEILSRVRTAAMRKDIRERILKPGEGLLDQVARTESVLDQEESAIEIKRETESLRNGSLDERLRRLGREAEVDERLDGLRANPADSKDKPQGDGP